MPVTLTVLKNTANEAVVRAVGDGAATITKASLTTSSSQSAVLTTGSPVIRVGTPLGIVVGGTVTGTGIPGATTVLSINQSDVTLSANATATGSEALTFQSQVADANSTLAITKVVASSSGVSLIDRGGVRVLNVHQNANWRFDGFSLNDQPTTDIALTLPATNATVILEIRKDKFGAGDHPYRSIYS